MKIFPAFFVTFLLCEVGRAAIVPSRMVDKLPRDAAVESMFKAIYEGPKWEYQPFEKGADRELVSILLRLNELTEPEIRVIVSRLMQAEDNDPIANTWFKVYAINRLAFDIPVNATWRETPRVLGGFGRPEGIESAIWPLMFVANGEVRIASRDKGYMGPKYQGLQEFDAFAAVYKRRNLASFARVEPKGSSPRLSAESTSMAKTLATTVRKADTATISVITKSGTKQIKFSEEEWIERLAKILEACSYSRREPCACMPDTFVDLCHGNEVLASLSVHHGDQVNVNAGSLFGVFYIGNKNAKALIDLINEKKNGN